MPPKKPPAASLSPSAASSSASAASRFKKPAAVVTGATSSTSTNGDKTKTSDTKEGPVVLYWHRTDLRLHDSPALSHALALQPSAFYAVWTWDPHYVHRARAGVNRWRFLLECMRGLDEGYQRISTSSSSSSSGGEEGSRQRQKLWVVREAPATVLPRLWREWGVDVLVFETDGDWYARRRDEEVMRLAREAGVRVEVKPGRTLWEEREVVRRNGGKAVMSMGQLLKATDGWDVERPPPAVERVPAPGCDVLESLRRLDAAHEVPPAAATEQGVTGDLNEAARTKGEGKEQYVSLLGPRGDAGVPTLEELGMDPADAESPHHGGEGHALAELKRVLDDAEYTATFEKPKTAPTDFSPRATTVLSPHLHFGSLGVRQFYWGVVDVFEARKRAGKKVAAEPMNLLGQLKFRDMYFAAQYAVGDKFQGEEANPVVRVVDWYLPSDGKGGYEVDSEEAEQWFIRWREGRTGFPFIDALMRQLKREGWIHHLGRHMVACFLTRGGCYVHWERGKEVFEEWLVDHESASNAGNWMWLSCTAFFSQFFRCYSPVSFGKKWDPEGAFVRHYVPELANFDKKYIYEPWKAPIADQKKWGCLVKGDGAATGEGTGSNTYPKPMFDFNERRTACLDGMKHAYGIGMYGADTRRLNGEWKKLFGKESNGSAVVQGDSKKKRARNEDEYGDNEEQHESDAGDKPDQGDVMVDERPKKAAKSAPARTGKGQQQAKLDGMVTRGKKK